MADYIGITEAQSNPFAPLTSELVKQLRDNPIAIAEGASGAPRIQTAAIQNNAVTQPKIANNSVGTGELRFSTRSFSRSFTDSTDVTPFTFNDAHAFVPRFTSSSNLSFASYEIRRTGTSDQIRVSATGTAGTTSYTIQWRYVTS